MVHRWLKKKPSGYGRYAEGACRRQLPHLSVSQRLHHQQALSSWGQRQTERGPCLGCSQCCGYLPLSLALLFSQSVPLGQRQFGSMYMVGTMVGSYVNTLETAWISGWNIGKHGKIYYLPTGWDMYQKKLTKSVWNAYDIGENLRP